MTNKTFKENYDGLTAVILNYEIGRSELICCLRELLFRLEAVMRYDILADVAQARREDAEKKEGAEAP